MKTIERKMVKVTLEDENVTAQLEAEKYPDTPLLDTYVQLSVEPFTISYDKAQGLINELNQVINKYKI